jgi:hypothetical protein
MSRHNREVTVVAFDEAGNTGEDLLNLDQPVFTLASVVIDPASASVLAEYGTKELHFKAARRSHVGRETVIRVLTDPALSPETVRTVALHKRFSVVAKMVDLLVEPLAALTGYDLYAEGAHVAFSNLLFATLPVMLGDDDASRVFKSFVAMCRLPSPDSRAAFARSLEEAAQRTDGATREHLDVLATGAAVGAFGGGGIPDLDPAPPCLIALAHSWAAAGDPFAILHDDRPELQRWRPYLAKFWPGSCEPQTFVLYDGRTLTYPLPVTALDVATSDSDERLQIADVVAGSLQLVLNAQLGLTSDPVFAARLRNETPLLTWLVEGNVWPSLERARSARRATGSDSEPGRRCDLLDSTERVAARCADASDRDDRTTKRSVDPARCWESPRRTSGIFDRWRSAVNDADRFIALGARLDDDHEARDDGRNQHCVTCGF